jgi:hypothetical protein
MSRALDTSEANHDVGRKAFLDFEKVMVVEQASDDGAHVVSELGFSGNDVVEFGRQVESRIWSIVRRVFEII